MATHRQRQALFVGFFAAFAFAVSILSLSDAVPNVARSVKFGLIDIGRLAEYVLPFDLQRDDVPWRFDQIGHAAVWGTGMLGIGLGLRRRFGLIPVALTVLAVSVGFEALQGLLTATRSVSLDDAIGNLAGIAMATAVLALIGPRVDQYVDRHVLAA